MKCADKLELDTIYNCDCLDGMRKMIAQNMKVNLIVADPPYLILNTKAGSNSQLAKGIQKVNDEILTNNLNTGIEQNYLQPMWDLLSIPNIYLWCNAAQIKQYLDFFHAKHKCAYDIIVWHKTNAPPLFHNKYLSDKEYCVYFRKGGYCMPPNYYSAKTVYHQPINIKDKRKYLHPTIKPLNIISNIIENSTKENDIVLDPFMGSGTTAEACIRLNRRFIGFEINTQYFEASQKRLASIQ